MAKLHTRWSFNFSTLGNACTHSVVVLVLFLIKSVPGLETRHQVNYGTVFKELAPLYSTSEFWAHTFVIETLPPAALEHRVYRCNCPLHEAFVEKLSNMQKETTEIVTQTSSDIFSMVDDISEAITSRKRRTLLPFLSRKSGSVKGRARSKIFVHKLAAHLNDVEIKSRTLQSEFNHGKDEFRSFMSTSNSRMKEAFEKIKTTHKLLMEVESDIQTNLTKSQELQDWLLTNLLDQIQHHDLVRSAYDRLYEGVISLVNGMLSPLIIDHSHLLTIIKEIQSSVSNQQPRWHIVHTTPAYYYKHADFTVHRSRSKLLITLRFPITTLQQPFRVFRLSSFALPIDTTSNHGTSIVNIPTYLAFASHNISVHTTLLPEAFRECDNGFHFTHCHFNIHESGNPDDCSLALFTGDKVKIHDLCTFRLLPNTIVPNIISLNTTHLLLINVSGVFINCEHGLMKTITCHFCVVYLPCKCSLFSTIINIPERLTDCYKHDSDISITYPVNHILSQKYNGKYAFSQIAANESLKSSVNVSTKPFVLYTHPYTNSAAVDIGIGIYLDSAIAASKTGHYIDDNHVVKLSDERTCSPNTYSMVALIVSIVAVLVAVIAATINVFIYLKMSKPSSLSNNYKTCKCTSSPTVSADLQRSKSLPSVSAPCIARRNSSFQEPSDVKSVQDRTMTVKLMT